MFILKGVKVLCFDTLLEVLILKGVKVTPFVCFAGVDSKWVNDGKVLRRTGGSKDPPLQKRWLQPGRVIFRPAIRMRGRSLRVWRPKAALLAVLVAKLVVGQERVPVGRPEV